MKLGFSLPTAGEWATPENQIRIARQAEVLGYHSLWVFQRLLYALEPKNEYPPAPGKVWPKPFERVFDPHHNLGKRHGRQPGLHPVHPPPNQNINVNVFGRIPAGQDVSAGSYSATVTATISF